MGKERKKKIEYIGELFFFENSRAEVKRIQITALCLVAAVALCYAAAFALDGYFMRAFYVVAPYAFSLLPFFLCACAFGRIFVLPRQFTKKQLFNSTLSAKDNAVTVLIVFAVTVVGEIAMYVFEGQHVEMRRDLIFSALTLLQCGLLYAFWHILGKLKIACNDNNNDDKGGVGGNDVGT